LADQAIFDVEEVLLLKKRFFFTDAHVDTHDPIQLHLLYAQVRANNARGQYYDSNVGNSALKLSFLANFV